MRESGAAYPIKRSINSAPRLAALLNLKDVKDEVEVDITVVEAVIDVDTEDINDEVEAGVGDEEVEAGVEDEEDEEVDGRDIGVEVGVVEGNAGALQGRVEEVGRGRGLGEVVFVLSNALCMCI